MTIHSDMFDGKKEVLQTRHRIYVEWEGGYFITSIDPAFQRVLQEMVRDLGPPVKVQFRAENEGWVDGNGNPLGESDLSD